MKMSAIVRIILFALLAFILIGLLVGGLVGRHLGYYVFSHHDGYEDITMEAGAEQTVPASTVKKLSVDWMAGAIKICPGDTNDIRFSEAGAEGEHPMVWSLDGDQLEIRFRQSELFFGHENIRKKNLTIYVPSDWIAEEIEIDAADAAVTISDLTIGELELNCAAAACEVKNCDVNSLSVEAASGEIYFEGSLNRMETDAMSAECKAVFKNTPRSLELDSMSGSMELWLPASSDVRVNMHSLSGKCRSDFSHICDSSCQHSGGQCIVDVNTMSGDVTIHKNED